MLGRGEEKERWRRSCATESGREGVMGRCCARKIGREGAMVARSCYEEGKRSRGGAVVLGRGEKKRWRRGCARRKRKSDSNAVLRRILLGFISARILMILTVKIIL